MLAANIMVTKVRGRETYFVNMTPHDITDESGKILVPKGDIANVCRIGSEEKCIQSQPIKLYTVVMGAPTKVPEQCDDTFYITSLLYAQAMAKIGRFDFVSPHTVRDESGKVLGCDGFVQQ